MKLGSHRLMINIIHNPAPVEAGLLRLFILRVENPKLSSSNLMR
jgi:hypothetical protein